MEEKINLKSDEITEILGTPPKWIIRWGITVIFAVIISVVTGSIFFRYPEIVSAPVVVTAQNPPSVVMARASGKPAALLAADGQWVNKGDTLGVIENPANHLHVFELASKLRGLNTDNLEMLGSFEVEEPNTLLLGDLQSAYNNLARAVSSYNLFVSQGYHKQKVEALENEHKQYIQYYQRLQRQYNLTKEDMALTEKQFQRDSALYSSKVIAPVDFERAQGNRLGKQQAIESARLNLSNTAITIERLKQSIADTRLDYESKKRALLDDITSSHLQLTSSLSAWEKSYLLVAPTTGRLSQMSIWSSTQEVKAGDALFTITPETIGEIQARIVLPFQGAGKVKVGQRVNIKLEGYSYFEFGMLEGRVESISAGYTENGYPALVALPKGATTTYGHNIILDRELQGIAEISTEDLSVIQRLFSPLKHLYKSRME